MRWQPKAFRSGDARLSGGVLLAALAVIAVAWRLGAFVDAELAARDWIFRFALAESVAPRAFLVRITEADLARFGHPIPDETLAAVIAAAAAQQPASIGIDIYRDRPVGPGAEALARSLRLGVPVVFIEKLESASAGRIAPPRFARGRHVGFSDAVLDPDGAVRRGLLFTWGAEGARRPSFAWQLATAYLEPIGVAAAADPLDPRHLQLGASSLEAAASDDGGYVDADVGGFQLLLGPWPAHPLPSASLSEVVSRAETAEGMRGSVVVVGTDAATVKDDFVVSRAPYRRALGSEVHARLVERLIAHALGESPPLRTLPEAAEAAFFLLAAVAGVAAGLTGVRGIPVGVPVALIAPLAVSAVAAHFHAWLPAILPAVGAAAGSSVGLAHRYGKLRREREALMSLFGRYVSPQVASQLWRQRDQFSSDGKPRAQSLVTTTLFCDLQGFTGAAESIGASRLMTWIEHYTDAMATRIAHSGGVVDDFAGDGIKAAFGVPIPRTSQHEVAADAQAAVRCARAMARDFERLREGWERSGLPRTKIRIGIATGVVTAGSIGSAERLKYTTVGDTVNVAARLEAIDKESFASAPAAARILMSAGTRALLTPEFAVQSLGMRDLRGRGESVEAFELLEIVGERNAEDAKP